MKTGRALGPWLILLAMVPLLVGLVARDRMGSAFGLSGDFWSGFLMGVGIALVAAAIAVSLRPAKAP